MKVNTTFNVLLLFFLQCNLFSLLKLNEILKGKWLDIRINKIE